MAPEVKRESAMRDTGCRAIAKCSTYSCCLPLLLLGTGVGVECEGSYTGILAFFYQLFLGVVSCDRALGVAGGFEGALLLELSSRLFGGHLGRT